MPIEPNFSERYTNILGVEKISFKTENTTSGTVIQTKCLSLWHAYSGEGDLPAIVRRVSFPGPRPDGRGCPQPCQAGF